MVIQETPNEDFSEGTFPIGMDSLNALYENVIDATFNSFARDIILNLQPIKSAPSGVDPGHQAFRYNPIMRGTSRPAPIERNPGVHYESRIVTYKAHIKHTQQAIDEESPLGRINDNEVQTTMSIGSEEHIRDCVSATIDGKIYRLARGPRPIGLSSAKYIMAIWEEVSEQQDGAK